MVAQCIKVDGPPHNMSSLGQYVLFGFQRSAYKDRCFFSILQGSVATQLRHS